MGSIYGAHLMQTQFPGFCCCCHCCRCSNSVHRVSKDEWKIKPSEMKEEAAAKKKDVGCQNVVSERIAR